MCKYLKVRGVESGDGFLKEGDVLENAAAESHLIDAGLFTQIVTQLQNEVCNCVMKFCGYDSCFGAFLHVGDEFDE